MQPKKKAISLLLAICLVVGLLPTTVFAANDTGKAIQLVDSGTAANISGGQADNIYFGTYKQSSDGNSGYNTDPIKWRVLSNAGGQLFLLSDQNLDVFQYHKEYESVTWETSTMRSWLNGYDASKNNGGDSGTDYSGDNFLNTAFSSKEQGAIADTTVVNDNNPDYSTAGGNNTTDKIFLLSIAEARNNQYFTDDNSRIATNTAYVAGGGKIGTTGMYGVGAADYWWLRSPGNYADDAADVPYGGGVDSHGNTVDIVRLAVRPAFNLNLNSVLFTSAAVGGKIPAASGGGNQGAVGADAIFEIPASTTSEWKLTLLDQSRSFVVTEDTAAGKPGDTITLNYSGATPKTDQSPNEYISVIIADSTGNEALYYGRVAQPTTAGGQVSIVIPSGLAPGSYALKVFSEQYNGGADDDTKLTDYASAFDTVTLTVTGTPPTITTTSLPDGTVNTAYNQTLTATGDATITWSIKTGTTLPAGLTLNSATGEISGTPTAEGTSTFTVVASNGVSPDAEKELSIKVNPVPVSPVYKIEADTQTLNFGSAAEGYTTTTPAEITVTIKNTDNQPITLTQPTATNYTIGTLSKTTLAAGETATFTVQPKGNLTAGTYNETISVQGANGGNSTNTVSIAANFEVTSGGGGQPQPTTYAVTISGGGTGASGAGSYAAGDTVTIYAGTRSNYSFAGWTSPDVNIPNPNNATTSFTMPDKPVTVTATWTYNGGGDDSPSYSYFTITASAGAGGSISPSGRSSVREGLDKTYAITPESGYAISDVLVDGKSVGAVSRYTFDNVQKSHTIEAQFVENIRPNPDTGAGNPFTDVKETDWFYEDVLFVYENGIMLGTSDTTFSPNGTATRGMMAAILWRMEGSPDPSNENPFTDVPADEYYTDAITWTNERGIFDGYGGGLFGPDDPITRQQLATIFYRYAGYKGYDLTPTDSLDRFTDKGEIADWAQEAAQWAVGSGLMFGTSNTTFAPTDTATRAQIAAMLHRFIEKYDLIEGITYTGLMGWIKPDLILPPKTGDASSAAGWISLMAAGVTGAGICTYKLRRRKKDDFTPPKPTPA